MNDTRHNSPRDCPSLGTLRLMADTALPPSEEEDVIAHLNDCCECRQRLEALDQDIEGIKGLRRIYSQLPTLDMDAVRQRCIPSLPSWQTRGGYVELTPGLRLSLPRDRRFVASLGRFDIVGILGRGAMGFVLQGFDPNLQRPVAVKLMKPELDSDPLASDFFLREARSAARLQHPNVVTIYEVSTEAAPWFIVMEYVRGKSLSSIIDCESYVRPVRAARITLEILAALGCAHDEGIIHRDVKPSNVLLDARTDTAKLADFGLARGVDDAMPCAAEGTIIGTPWYVAPEQAAGKHRLDGRCDLFSTGVMLFEMLTGVLPFSGHDSREVVNSICHDPAPDPREFDADIPSELADAITKVLQKNPASRFETAADFAEVLHAYLAAHQSAADTSTELWAPHPVSEDPNVIAAMLEMTQTKPPFQGRVWIQRSAVGLARDILTVTRDNRDCCRIGETFRLQVQADVDCYVTLLDVGTSGKMCVLLLNHHIHGGEVVALSGPDKNHEWVVGGPVGTERIKALFTRQPVGLSTLKPFSPLASSGRSRDIVARIKQVEVSLQRMPSNCWTDAMCQFVVVAE